MTKKRTSYLAYLQSSHWKNLREEAFSVHGKNCQCCLDRPGTAVHHLTYGNLKSIKVDMLRPVCHGCHRRIHKIMRKIRNKISPLEKWTYCTDRIRRRLKNRKPFNPERRAYFKSRVLDFQQIALERGWKVGMKMELMEQILEDHLDMSQEYFDDFMEVNASKIYRRPESTLK